MKYLGLFEGYGIELEYMIVDAQTLDVAPLCDRLLAAVAGDIVSEIELDEIAWSNELVLHVVEMKTNGPASSLLPLPEHFQAHVDRANCELASLGARLMPGAMHPWMNPRREMHLWPHEYSPVYAAYDRIFGCSGHGWANLQSMHINLPFANDEEFRALHGAIRLLLPIMPALAASSPIYEGRRTALLDNRLDVYRTNAVKIPSITGRVIPEPVYSQSDYERDILDPMYADIAPFDTEGVLQEEFLNSRGAIARFCRHSIEIRVLDIQECPRADLAIATAIDGALKAVVSERFCPRREVERLPTHMLERVFLACIQDAGAARIDAPEYLAALGYPDAQASAAELWHHLIESNESCPPPVATTLQHILGQGPLAQRILRAVGDEVTKERLAEVYGELCHSLATGELFGT